MASTSSSTSSFEAQWTENTCAEIAKKDFFPLLVKDIDIQKTIITRFIVFYSGGRKKQGLSVIDLIFAVISIMPQHEQTEEFIWDAKQYSENGTLFSVSPKDKDKQNRNAQEDTNDSDNTKNTFEPMLAKAYGAEIQEHVNIGIDKQNYNVNKVERKIENDVQNEVVGKVQNSEEIKNLTENLADIKSTNNSLEELKEVIQKEYTKLLKSSDGSRESEPKVPVFSSFNWGYNKKTPPRQNDLEENMPHYGPIENHAFHISCNRLLDVWHTSKVARITLKYFFGIIALVLMRATTKKDKHLKKTFAGSKILTVVSFSNDLKYFIPHNRCLWNSYKTLRKRDGNIPILFAKIILNSSRIDALLRMRPKLNHPKLNIFRFAVLSHTSGFGFGLVIMSQNLESKIGNEDFNKMVKATFCDLTAQSWNILHDFIIKYKENGRDVTHDWARVISNDYFRNLSCPANLALSVILGVFIEEITKSSDIWRSAWAQTDENIEELKKLGYGMYKNFKLNQAQSNIPSAKNAKNTPKTFISNFEDCDNLIDCDNMYSFADTEYELDDFGREYDFDFGDVDDRYSYDCDREYDFDFGDVDDRYSFW